MIPASGPLPPICGITAVALCSGVDEFLTRLDRAIDNGLRLVQVRDKQLSAAERRRLTSECVARMKACGGKVLVNDDAGLAREVGADGVHVSSGLLASVKPGDLFGIVGVSCHGAGELSAGLDGLDADFAVLSPVRRTLTHVDAAPLGWDGFAELASQHSKPVYALGGLKLGELLVAQAHGAAGLASMRDSWGFPAYSAGAAEAA